MTQAILTRYHGPTAVRPLGRIVAKTASGRDALAADYDSSLSAPENHRRAAIALATKLRWPGDWHGAPDSKSGYAFAPTSATSFTIT